MNHARSKLFFSSENKSNFATLHISSPRISLPFSLLQYAFESKVHNCYCYRIISVCLTSPESCTNCTNIVQPIYSSLHPSHWINQSRQGRWLICYVLSLLEQLQAHSTSSNFVLMDLSILLFRISWWTIIPSLDCPQLSCQLLEPVDGCYGRGVLY